MRLGEQTFSADARRLDTYVFEEGQWRLVAMVASRVLKPLKPVAVPPETLAEYVDTFFDPDDLPAARTIFRRDSSGKVIAWSYVNGDQEVVARKSD